MTRAYDEPDARPNPVPATEHDALAGIEPGAETICCHLADDRHRLGGSAATPIFQASTFVYPDLEAFEQRKQPGTPYFEYTRVGNPTTSVLQAKLAKLEQAEWSYVLSSGMAAICAALNACLHTGAHIVVVERCYYPAARYLRNYLPRFGVDSTFVAGTNADDFIAALRPETRVVYLESPTSGAFEVVDLQPIIAAAKERDITVIFDNSWASPLFFNPLAIGCDLVVHSATKFIGGHSDVVAGVVAGRSEQLERRVFREVELVGGTIDPFAAWLLLRGVRTLSVRMERHQSNALAVARTLETHSKVRRVRHPGLPSHPEHERARDLFHGSSSLFGFELVDQSQAAARRFIDALQLFHIGVSWGGYESLALGGTFFSAPSDPALIIRLHVGLETEADLIRDVEQALDKV